MKTMNLISSCLYMMAASLSGTESAAVEMRSVFAGWLDIKNVDAKAGLSTDAVAGIVNVLKDGNVSFDRTTYVHMKDADEVVRLVKEMFFSSNKDTEAIMKENIILYFSDSKSEDLSFSQGTEIGW